jgi:hypothetical protein
MKRRKVLRTARGRASPVDREEAVERIRRLNSSGLGRRVLQEIGDSLER